MAHIITQTERDAFAGPIEELVRLVAPDVVEKLSRILLRHVVREDLNRVCSEELLALKLDVVVLTPEELDTEMMEAYARGMAAARGAWFHVD